MNELIFRFYLNFKNDAIGRLEITEPIGFDGATFTIEQDKKRYGRDVTYGNEEVSLDFYSGVYSNGLTFEFENLINYYKEFGFESEVEFIVNKNGIDFVVGLLDFQLAETDQITYFKTKVIQNTNKAIVKRRNDVNVDVFSDKDLDNESITPLVSENIFLKAKPVVQVSEWQEQEPDFGRPSKPNYMFLNDGWGQFNVCRALTKFGVKDSLTFIDRTSGASTVEKFKLIRSDSLLTNINIKIKSEIKHCHRFSDKPDPTGQPARSSFVIQCGKFTTGDDFSTSPFRRQIYENVIQEDFNVDFDIPEEINYEFPFTLEAGSYLILWFATRVTAKASNVDVLDTDTNSHLIFDSCVIDISATSTAISSVIKGVRYIDYVKQVFKSATGLNVIAPKFDLGGKFYDNFVFNGKLIRQFVNEPFYGTIKENTSQLVELNSDLQINSNNVFIGQYSDFYTNKDLGAFVTAPEMGFKSSFNDRYAINTLEYKYKSFEQDRNEENTIDAIHTDTQWLLPNKQVENTLKIDVDFIRDPFEIESARRQGVNTKETTSLSNDNKVYQIDIVALEEDARNEFTAVLNFQYSDTGNTFKIISNGTFAWETLGFKVGDTIQVNTIDYVVNAFDGNILILDYSGALNTSGELRFTINYPLSDVAYTNRTNQEFDLIDNIQTGDNFSNLQYSIGRNLEHWYSYLKTASKFTPTKSIKNTFFKSNGNAKTQFRGGRVIQENADILVSQLDNAILSPYVYNTKVVADYNDVLSVLEQMETINTDNSIGGFIRVMDNNFRLAKLYPTRLSYTWATAELDIIGEVKQESEYLEVFSLSSGLIVIDEVGYERNIIFPLSLQTENDYIQILDRKGIALNNKVKFDKVRVNSIIFSNIVELSDNLLTLR